MPMKRIALSMPEKLSEMSHDPEERKVTRIGDQLCQAAGSTDVSKGSPKGPRSDSANLEGYRKMDSENKGEGQASNFLYAIWSAVESKIPALKWMPTYDVRRDLFYDVTGGTTIALICLVQTLAHAAIATTSIIQGPYTAFVPPLMYALMGTSRHVSVASGAIAAILIADQLQEFDNIEDRTHLASMLSFASGVMLVIMGLCNAAFAVRFLSQSLISGFVTGGSILIIEGQMKNLLGLDHLPHVIGFVRTTLVLIENVGDTNINGLILGLVGMCFLQVAMWTKKRLVRELKQPGPHPTWKWPLKIATETKELVLVFVSLIFAYVTCPEPALGEPYEPIVPVVGVIPAGLPQFNVSWNHHSCQVVLHDSFSFHHFLTGSAMVALTSFLTTYATSKKQALIHGYPIDASQEMVALGFAGIGGSFFGSFAPSGSLSRTSLAGEVGVRTQLNGMMKVVIIGSTLVYFTPVLYFMPKASLAAIILRSTWNLIDFDYARNLRKDWKPFKLGGMKRDMIVWWTAFLLTVFCGVLYGIGAAVLISLCLIVKDAAMPRLVTLASIEELGGIWRDAEVWSEGRIFPGILIVELRGNLSFASAAHFQEELEKKQLGARSKVHVVVLSFGSVHDIDISGISTLRDVFAEWRKRENVSCIVADAKSRVRLMLENNFAHDKLDDKGNVKEVALLDQPAFMINIDDAVYLAKRLLKARREGKTTGLRGETALPFGFRSQSRRFQSPTRNLDNSKLLRGLSASAASKAF